MKKRLLKALSVPLALLIGFPLALTIGTIQWIITGNKEHSIEERVVKYFDYLDS